MSRFIRQADPTHHPFPTEPHDDWWMPVEERYTRDGENGSILSDVVWPRSRMLGANLSQLDGASLSYGLYPWITRLGGSFEPWQITGQYLNQSSQPVANVVVDCYDDILKEVVDTQTTDNNGTYSVGSPFGSGRSFTRGYLVGSPDTSGTSQNNLP